MPDKNFDISVPIPTITKVDRYTAESPVGPDIVVLSIPIPTVTLSETSVSEVGYVTGYEEDIPIPDVSVATATSVETPVDTSYEHYVMTPEIASATRYMAETPVLIPLERQIMIPEITLETGVFVFTAVDTFFSFETPGTYTDQTTEANDATPNDVDLFPVSAGIWDGFLIGMKHPYWDRIRIDIGTAGVGTWEIEWLYWNGVNWAGIGSVEDDTNSLKVSGRNNVVFEQPTLWTLSTLNGAERYWVYMRIVTIDALTIRPLGTQVWAGVIASRLKNTRQTMNEQVAINYMTHLDNTPGTLPIGKAFVWQFKLVDYRDNASPRSLLNPTVYISHTGVEWEAIGAAFSEVEHGWYSIEISSSYATGRAILRAIAPGSAQCDLNVEFT